MNTNLTIEQQETFKTERMTPLVRIRHFFAPPIFEDDEEKTRVARLLNTVLLSMMAVGVLMIAISFVFAGLPATPEEAFMPLSSLITLLVIGALFVLTRHGHVRTAAVTLLSLIWIIITLWIYGFARVASDANNIMYVLTIVLAGVLLNKRVAFVFTAFSLLAVVGEFHPSITDISDEAMLFELIITLVVIALTGVLLGHAVDNMTSALDLARHNQRALAERNREMEAGQRVTSAASERVSPDELMGLVVDLIRDQFDLYHVQVYMVDEEQKAAVLRESTGYAGQQLLQKKHHIPLEHPALVTQAIHEGQPVLVTDVNQNPSFLPNPLLPDTRSELVVPLRVRDKVIGVLDVQDRRPGRFNKHTVTLFQTMADQITFLFENSELLEHISRQTEALTLSTNQLRTSAEIARYLSTILDPQRLLQQVVELIQSRFGLYHAHIYILDEAAGQLVVRAGSGEVGRVLRERGHKIPLDKKKSLVARAAREREPVLVGDTSLTPDFMPNPLLPQTRSEAAVPLVAGDKLMGVLDVQDDQPGRFTTTDLDTLSTLSGQTATALQNAELFEQAERNLAETRARLEVSQALASAQTEDEVLDAMIQAADFYPQAQVVLLTFDQEADERSTVARRIEAFDSGLGQTIQAGMRFPTSMFPLLQLISSNEPFISSDLIHDERADPATRELAKQSGGVSIAVLPITVGNEWLGLIAASSKQKGYFDERKLFLYQSLAEQGAIALQAARLRDDLQRSEERLRGILEASPIPTVVTRVADGVVLFGNQHLSELFGIPSEEMIGQVTPDFYYDPADRQVILEAIQKDKYLHQKEVRLKRSDGTPFWALLSLRVVMFDDEPSIISGIHDITERKQAEVERARFTTQLRTAADLAEQINAILDPDQLLQEVVTQLHDRFDLYHVHVYILDDMTGDLIMRAGSGAVGAQLREQGHKIPLDRKQSLVARAARRRGIVAVGDTSAEPNFMPNPLLPETRSEVAIPLIASDRVLGVLDVQDSHSHRFTHSDLDTFSTLAGQIATALQNADFVEKIQQTTQRLREVDRLKSEFLANMSHELRTPLNSILGYTELIMMDLEEELDPETMEDIEAIHNNGQHLLSIINNILDLAKIEAGRMTLNLSQVSLEPLLEQVKNSAAGLTVNKPVDLQVEVESDLPAIQADPVRLQQIFNNLVSNAIKFTDEGHINLRAFHLPFKSDNARSDKGWICVEVKDTGIGISEEDQRNIFDKFQQADGSFQRRAEGTGLGLSITRYLVHMHGGTIEVHSQLGQGSTFTVRLPIEHESDKITIDPANEPTKEIVFQPDSENRSEE